jgi:hypothetical protein
MARRQSPMLAKQHLANMREFKRRIGPTLDPDQVREQSRAKADAFRKRSMPSFLALRLERATEARLLRDKGESAVALRRALLAS